jgi:hypothetical protein
VQEGFEVKILIEVMNGDVASITATNDVDIFIVNHDKGVTSEKLDCYAPDAVVSNSEFDNYLKEATEEAKNSPKSQKEIFVLVKMFQGMHDGVELFWDEKESEKAYKKYTGQEYPQDGDFEKIHEDFRDSIIYLVKVPQPGVHDKSLERKKVARS